MSEEFVIDENVEVLVKFEQVSGLRQTAGGPGEKPAELAETSKKALDASMNNVHHMSRRFTAVIEALTDPPSKAELEFGLTLDAKAGSLITSAGVEAAFKVTLTWERNDK